jgi:hypothetical protein
LANFTEHYDYSWIDVYGKSGDRSFSRMKFEAGLIESFNNIDEEVITKRFKNLFHINSRKLIEFATRMLALGEGIKAEVFSEKEKLMLGMLYYSFYLEAPEKQGFATFEEGLSELCINNKKLMKEALEILQYNYLHIDFVDKHLDLGFECPLDFQLQL